MSPLAHLVLVLSVWAPVCTWLAGAQSIPVVRVPRQQASQAAPSIFTVGNNVSVADSNGFAYLAKMDIGAQDFMVLLDTGSSDLWVVSSNCTGNDCLKVPKYQPTPTLDLSNSPFELDYLLGAVTGVVATENISIGSFEIITQVFALANQTRGLGLSATGNSGILGLSFPFEASIPDTLGVTLLENLLSSLEDSDRYFAIKLGRDDTSSSFTVGQLDPAIANSTDNFTFTDVYPLGEDSYDYWKLPLQSLTINHTSFPLSKSRVVGSPSPIAVTDTGTTLILGPSDDVDRFWMSVGASRKTPDLGWQVRCDRGVVIGFNLGSGDSQKEYFLDPADLSWLEGGKDGDWCLGGVQANDDVSSGDWLLGDTFLRNVYVVHHAATSSQPPSLGLLGLTNPDASLQSFLAARGNDPTGPVSVITTMVYRSHGLSAAAIYSISAATGFVFGALLTSAISICVERKYKKKY